MIISSKAPFRLGLAGGGTDVSPYSDVYGGAILNATVNLYATTTLIPKTDNKIILKAKNLNTEIIIESMSEIPIDGVLDLQKGVYNRVIKEFNLAPLAFEMTTEMDVPSGSGLGTSSTLVVSILGAFVEWLNLPLGDYDIAQLAYKIEREDLNMAGGKQDQYAAAFGGINFLEFHANNKVIVNPLRIKKAPMLQLAKNLLLFYTKTSRESAKIIEIQATNVATKKAKPIQAMHLLKAQAYSMKTALLQSDLTKIGEMLDNSWKHKKEMATGISNTEIDDIYSAVMNAGALGGKISGAGGGGFMIFYVPQNKRNQVESALSQFKGEIKPFEFCMQGLTTETND